MSPAFIKGIKENLPNAQITFDKFHIIKIINEGVDKVRRAKAKENPILRDLCINQKMIGSGTLPIFAP